MLGKNLIQAAAGNAGAAGGLGIEEVFSTWLYTGNGGTQTITNGIDLAGEGGMVWLKDRTAANSHYLYDTARGATKFLRTNATSAEVTNTDTLTAFNSNGFSIGVFASHNTTGNSIASWTFRKAPGFFDVVTYTGTGANRTVAHNLGSVPGTIIVKRTDTSANWQVYHRSLANTEYLVLNSKAAKATGTTRWNSTTPTSSVFSLGTDATVNASGGTYVAYLFAHDEQIFGEAGDQSVIKCGSYTGNGSTSGPVIDLGWEPQWVFIKCASRIFSGNTYGGNGYILDNMRGINTGSGDPQLQADESNSEGISTSIDISLTPTGFQLTSSGVGGNASGGTYIYIAIRRGPMKTPTAGTDVFGAYTFTSPQTFTLPTGWAPDLVTRLQRNVNDSFARLFGTRLQGGNVYLATNSTASETAAAVFTFDKTGGQASAAYGAAGVNLVSYGIRRAPGFFDVVAYTGNGVAGRNVNHNLAAVPELIIVKERSVAGGWDVYAAPLGNSANLKLNTDVAVNTPTGEWNNTTPTSTVFTVGINTNGSGRTIIAYLFATLPGISKVGSYTGTATTQQINCGFTSGARFVLIKRTDSTGDWYVWDTARGIVSGNDPYLLLNSTAAEVTSTDYIDPYSAGFEISSTAPAAINANGGSFIYLAIA